jgi:beta-ketoacyl-acyl-carrier-protein synthase II
MKDHNNRQRVVVTGLGAISPLGSSVEQLWQGWMKGASGIRRITQFDPSGLPCQIAGEIPDFVPEDYMERKEARRNPRSGQIGLAAAMQAVRDAGFSDELPNSERCGVCFGTAIGGLDWAAIGIQTFHERGLSKVNPFTIPGGIPNLSSFLVARQFQVLGPNATVTTACATGTQSIGEAAEWIRHGKADVVISGGTESLINDFSIAGFCAMRALPTNYNHNPQAASRPFDAKREGFIFSEGAASLVLESLEHALARGARIYAEIAGQASSSDALHIAAPDPEAKGPIRAMRWALADAQLQPHTVDYINAHGSSTPLNDSAETYAIKQVFGEHAYRLSISSTKSMLGHAMGASGSLEALACILAIVNGWLPPTINYEVPDPDCDLDYVPNQARQMDVRVALSNSFGLGGQNACLIFKKYTPDSAGMDPI